MRHSKHHSVHTLRMHYRKAKAEYHRAGNALAKARRSKTRRSR